jgi:protein SCO1/2
MKLLSAIHRVLLCCVIALASANAAWADAVRPDEIAVRKEPLPKRLEGIDVVEKLDTHLPLDLGFTDESGKPVLLRDYVDGKVPVIVTLNYSNCPMLCNLQLGGFVKSLKQVEWTAGKEFRIVTVSLDPEEKPAAALRTKRRYLGEYGRPEADSGWHFLTGSANNVRRVADAIGFQYAYNEKRKEYVHPAAMAMLTPDGRIARYLYGIEYHPKTVHLSLVDVSEGRIGSTMDRLILFCFHFDETEGRYAPFARNIMRLGGAVAVLLVGGLLGSFWLMELRKKRRGVT